MKSIAKKSNVIIFLNLVLLFALFSANSVMAAFPDVPGHAYETAIDYVELNGIVQGYPDGKYKPDNNINRAEFTKIIVSAVYGVNQTGSNCFPDVHNEWFAPFICTAQNKGIIEGYPDGWFAPEAEVNFAEALKIVLNAYNAPVGPDYDEWFRKYLDYAIGYGLEFALQKNANEFVTRGEMAETIYWIDNLSMSPNWPAGDDDEPNGDGENGHGFAPNGCMSDAECLPDEYCDPSGICILSQPSCVSDTECALGEYCGPNGFCIGTTSSYPFCTIENDCYTGQSCVQNYCEFNNPGDPCASDADCSVQSQFCVNHQCTETILQCSLDSECDMGAGEYCDGGICMHPCVTDLECPVGQVCDMGTCNIIYVTECYTDLDCDPGQTCDPVFQQCLS